MRWMHGFWLFAAGTLAGMLIVPASAGPKIAATASSLNHVAMYVRNFDESMNFYIKTMGFREAFSFKDKEGKPIVAYLQISRDTFLELLPADADHPVGYSHAGIWVEDIKATIEAIRQEGVKVDDPQVRLTKAKVTFVTDPNGLRMELLEFAPESMQRKAIDSWR
jgi:catechol 2,3-dioxygenase-like lactoylglutathione lyase family enzyme